MSTTTSPQSTGDETPSTTTPPLERNDTPLTYPSLTGLFVTSFFPHRIPLPTILTLAVSAVFSWLVFLHPYLPPAITRSYSYHLTKANLILVPFALTFIILVTMIPAWWAGEGVPFKDFGKSSLMETPAGWVILVDLAAHIGFVYRLCYDMWRGKKEKTDE
jgi:hypothetical protein